MSMESIWESGRNPWTMGIPFGIFEFLFRFLNLETGNMETNGFCACMTLIKQVYLNNFMKIKF